MPNPTRSDVHVNALLTQMSVAFFQQEKDYVADKVFPIIPVEKQSDRYFVYDRGDLLRIEAQERAPSSESAGGGFRLDNTPTYFAKPYALHKDIDDNLRGNADAPLDMDRDAMAYLVQQMLMKRDSVFAANFMAASVWSGRADRAGVSSGPTGDQFIQFNQTASTPIQEIEADKVAIKKKIGRTPNVLVVGEEVWQILKQHAQFVDRIKYTSGPQTAVTTELVAAMLGLDRVVVAGAIYNSAKEGQTASTAFITGKKMLLCYAAPTPSLLTPSAGYTFAWQGLWGAVSTAQGATAPAGMARNAVGARIKKFRMEHLSSDRIEAEMAFDLKVVVPEAGIYYYDAVA